MEEIKSLIEEYFEMDNDEKIDDYLKEIIIENDEIKIILKRRVLKHIVERRKQDEYSKEELINLFFDTYHIVSNKKYKIVENKKENHYLLLEILENKNNGVVLVMEIILINNNYHIKTGFYRSSNKIKKLLLI